MAFLGRELVGDAANQAWGVMDVLAVTDFPDIRCKTLIQSASANRSSSPWGATTPIDSSSFR